MRTWLITGASSGLGKGSRKRPSPEAIARGHARNVGQAESIASRHPDTALALSLDVCDEEAVHAAIQAAEEWYGGVDVLVNNAGYGLYGAIEEASDL